MKTRLRIISIAALLGVALWISDAIIDSLIFYHGQGTFWQSIVGNVPAHELYMRTLVLACFVAFGIAVAEVTVRHRRLELETSALSRFPSEDPNPVLRISAEGKIIYRNEPGSALMDTCGVEIGGKVSGKWLDVVTGSLNSDQPRQEELKCGNKIFTLTFAPVVEAGYVNVYGLDVTAQRVAAEALRESERLYRSLFSGVSEGFSLHEIICDENGKPRDYRFLEVNPAFERLTGLKREDILGKTVLEVLPETEPYWIQMYGKVALTGEPVRFENYAKELGRHYETFAFCPQPGQFGVLFLDVTDRKKAEEQKRLFESQIQHAQKLESLGVLAGGIAHDFNNLLVAILGYADLALRDSTPESPVRGSLAEIRQAAIRAADLTNQMLAYSGKGRFVVEPLELNRLVDEMGHLLKVSISKKVVLRFDLSDNMPIIEADASQIRQIVMNLITNASEAIGDNSGVVTITTGMMEASRDYLAQVYLDENLPEGYYAFIEVADTGCGMDKETSAQLFDPFFTTKFTGRGLGMSAVLGIVRGHHGGIKVYSEVNKGATIKVLLPCSNEAPAPVEASSEADSADAVSNSGTILVADDEDSVRTVAKMMLERAGFSVLTAADGAEAMDMFNQHTDDIAAVLLDMTMPKLSGEQVFRKMRHISPNVQVVLSSGYNEQDATNRFAGKGLAGFIQKPYDSQQLIAKFRSVLYGTDEK